MELPIKLTDDEKQINNVDGLYPIIVEAFKIKDSLTFLEIKTEDDLAIAHAKTTDAKKLIKQVENKRKDLTAPIDKQKKVIMDLEKRILRPLLEGVEDLSNRIIAYQDELDKKKREELKKLQEAQTKIVDWKEELKKLEIKIYDAIDSKTDMNELQEVARKAVFNKEGNSALQKLVSEAKSDDINELSMIVKDRVRQYGGAKKAVLSGDTSIDLVALRKSLEQQMNDSELMTTNAEAVVISSEIKTISEKKSIANIRKSVKFELEDISIVPKTFLKTVVDEDKVNEFIKTYEDKEKLYERIEEAPDRVIVGLKFRVEKSHVGR
jgi:hypothetical protein